MTEIDNMEMPKEAANGDVIAIVLAAGRSQRFGSDKRLTPFADGETLLSQTLSAVLPDFPHTYLVIKAEDDPHVLLSQAYLNQVHILRAPQANCGLGNSLADAFQMLQNAHGLAAAIFLGDMPWLSPATCQRLIALATAENIVRPRYKSQVGHPVIFGRNFWSELRKVKGEDGAREFFKHHIQHCIWVDVDDAGVTLDIDYPGDLQKRGL
ncbi:nucleotidyltransferase family protein [Marinobacter sp. BSs20148]|uniref:nucleotidyltransferase family protein n=1 Tax=Marinobacter sp. BSs20148 TaxID=490759 RepID=UPI00117C852B|nr:nucleotidyltransferase family protein [Marinobacter sp. BSs20148]